MREGLDALSEKEKETLRLIVRGHDAKTAASALNRSVHTVNERLRAARRKLDVTSSREAARLLFEHEQSTPEKSVDMEIGDASQALRSQSPAMHRNSLVLWLGGVALMISLIISAAFMLPQDWSVPSPASPIETVQLSAFEQSARDWLALVDRSDWEASFAATGKAFQELNTIEMWRDASLQAREPLGEVIARETLEAQYVHAPPEGYVVMVFRTEFAERDAALEKVTLEDEGGVWKVVAYVIEQESGDQSEAERKHLAASFCDAELAADLSTLLAVAQIGPDGEVFLNYPIGDTRFFEQESGLYWQISAQSQGDFSSRSLWDRQLKAEWDKATREERFSDVIEFADERLRKVDQIVRLPGSDVDWLFMVARQCPPFDGSGA